MLTKYLFLAAGRVAPPLVECVVSSQPPYQPVVGMGYVPILFEALPLQAQPFQAMPTSANSNNCSGGGLHGTAPLLSPPRAGDWSCLCGFSNFASRNVCFGCQRPRSDRVQQHQNQNQAVSVKPGDWCCACGTHNFAKRTNCMTCEAPRPVAATYPQSTNERILPGDWLCASCQAHNFRSRAACVKCGEKKSSNAEPASAMGVPWTCAACHTANPSSRRDCEICGVTKPNELHMSNTRAPPLPGNAAAPSAGGGALSGRPGDWICPQCNFSNFAARQHCKSCASARSDSGVTSQRQPQEVKKGDWTCSCGCHNFARRLRCFECQATRPFGAGESSQPAATHH